MLMVQRLVTAVCLLGVVLGGCGGDDADGSAGVADAGSVSDPSGDTMASDDDAATVADPIGDTGASDDDATMTADPTDEEVAAACTAYCVYETQTCPDTSADADNDTESCKTTCMDPANASGLGGSAAESAACYMQTSAYLACLEGLSCEDFDAHLAGLNADSEYVDECTETLADDACL
jgi:hypothetical protein